MKNNKTVALALLFVASAISLAACGGTPATSSDVSGESAPAESVSSVTPSESSKQTESEGSSADAGPESSAPVASSEESSAEEQIVPTKVKIVQQGTLIVGDQLKISDFVTFYKGNDEITTTAYTLVSSNEKIAKPTADNSAIDIVGSGKTKVGIKSSAGKALGNINITALTKEAKDVSDFFANSDSTWIADLTWQDWEGTPIDEVTEDQILETEGDWSFMAVGKNYVWDGIYSELSQMILDADGNEYAFEILNKDLEEIDIAKALPKDYEYEGAAKLAEDIVGGVKVTERSKYSYYSNKLRGALTATFDMSAWTQEEPESEEDDEVVFTLNNPDTGATLFGDLFVMDVSNFDPKEAHLVYDKTAGTVQFEFLFDDSDYDNKGHAAGRRVVVDFVTGEDAEISIFAEQAKSLLPPDALDVSPITTEFAKFSDNYVVDWQLGYWGYKEDNMITVPVDEAGNRNYIMSRGVTLVDDDTMAYAYIDADKESGEFVESEDNSYSYGGVFVDTTEGGVYTLDADENNILTKNATPMSGSESVKDVAAARSLMNQLNTAAITAELLNAASLSLKEGIYLYTPSFDELALGAILNSFCPVYYPNSDKTMPLFEDPSYANYCEGSIILDAENSTITLKLFERLRFDDEGNDTGRLGFILTLKDAGQAKIDVGDNLREAFGLDAE